MAGGTADKRMENLSTKLSNLEIALKQLGVTIFQGGLGNLLKGITDEIQALFLAIDAVLKRFFESRELQTLPQQIQNQIRAQNSTSTNRSMTTPRLSDEGFDQFLQDQLDELVNRSALPTRRSGSSMKGQIKNQKGREVNLEETLTQQESDKLKNDIKILTAFMERRGFDATEVNKRIDEIQKGNVTAKTAIQDTEAGSDAIQAANEAKDAINRLNPLEKLRDNAVDALEPLKEINELQKFINAETARSGLDAGEERFSAEQLKLMQEQLDQMRKDIILATDENQMLASAIAEVSQPLDDTAEIVARLQDIASSDDGVLKTALFGDRDPQEVIQAIKDGGEATEGIGEIMSEIVAGAANQFTTEFVGALLAGEDALDSFNNFAKNMVSQIISTFLQLAVINNIINSIFGTNLSTISFGADGMQFNAAKAGGGTYQKAMPTLVGERGPELMIPNTGGTILNNMNTRNALSGGGSPIVVNQNLNFALGVVPTVRAEIQKQLPTIANTAKVAVLEGVQRGGSYRKGIHGA